MSEPIVDLFGTQYQEQPCTHDGLPPVECETRCDVCGCGEHCKPGCGCFVVDLPAGFGCPGNGCGCEGEDFIAAERHPPACPIDPKLCSRCDDHGARLVEVS